MAELQLGDVPVLRARVCVPRVGVWHAELTLDTDEAPSGVLTLATDDGALSMRGTVRSARTGAWQGYTEALLVGGADGLSRALVPRFYENATVRILLADLCRETGETLSSATDTGLLNSSVTKWVRPGASGGDVIAEVLRASGASWRVLSDGTLWAGRETWPNVEVPGDIMLERPVYATREVATETLYGLLAPGTVWDGRRVSYVEHYADAETTRTVAWFEATGAAEANARDRIKTGLDAFIRNVTREATYAALFPGVVLSQNVDGSLVVQPDAATLPAITNVPIRGAGPGRTVKVAANARVLLAFEGRDPRAPVAVLFTGDETKAQEVRDAATVRATLHAPEIKLGDNATRGIARVDDAVAPSTALSLWLTAVGTATGAGDPPEDFAHVATGSDRAKAD
jgi:hypothetical protein